MRGKQGLALNRQFTEAINQFFLQGIDIFGAFAVGEALVERQAFMDVGAVAIGQQGRGAQVNFAAATEWCAEVGGVQVFALFQRGDCLLYTSPSPRD